MLYMMRFTLILMCVLFTANIQAKTTIAMALTSGGQSIGSVTAEDTAYGLLLTPNLKNLTPGIHGFHVHQQASCAQQGKAAGGHLDPQNTAKHLGPYQSGHLGDLPVLIVDNSGNATLPVLSPRLKEADLKGRSLMIHANGDNYYDIPKKLGGGGSRLACGVVK